MSKVRPHLSGNASEKHPKNTEVCRHHRQHNIPHSIWLSKIGKDSGCKNEKTIAKGSLASIQGSLFLCKSLKILPAFLSVSIFFYIFAKNKQNSSNENRQ
ncbi:hypothetical protein [Segatella copri]|uniref:hypothetical protein n=1 Tax=Segatella copri TaxID=165179 RepID=UPI00115DFA75|nr:hypothetical protein [Segatella copri]